ncbi:MAG: lipase family protein [Salibacteraceae bacterium]
MTTRTLRSFLLLVSFFGAHLANGQLIKDSLIADFDFDDIDSIFTAAGVFPSLVSQDYEVEVYRITYSTPHPQGGTTTATGALAVPKGKACSPIMVYAHGTIAERFDVPSYLSTESVIGIISATSGYLVVMPDYLGLGDGPGFHPYVHAESEATATLDMLRASRTFCTNQQIGYSEQLFLTGYSQGGHAITAAHQMMQEQFSNEFQVTASAPMAGPHDLSGVMQDLMTSNNAYDQPGYAPYIVLGYQEAYGNIYNNLSDVFLAPYDNIIANFLNGQFDLSAVNSQLPAVPRDMFQASWINDFQNDSLHPMRVALRENNTYNWAPADSMRLYHCSGDNIVPYQNSTVAFNNFVANGATTVSQIDVSATLDHGPCAAIALLAGKIWFDTMVNDSCDPVVSTPDVSVAIPAVKVFPNPTKGAIQITGYPNSSIPVTLRVYNLQGLLLHQTSVSGNNPEVQLEHLPVGMYLVEVAGEAFVYRQKVLRQ